LVLYGCGDFLNDYEGIGGYGQFLLVFPLRLGVSARVIIVVLKQIRLQ